MNGQSFLDFRNELNKRGIVFTYSGFLNDDILTGIGNALRTKLALDHIDNKVSRGIFSAFVEQVQNVIRYSAESQGPELDEEGIPLTDPLLSQEIRYGMVAIGDRSDGKRFVTCCNMIEESNVDRLKQSLESIRGLDRKELTKLMREQLKDGPPEGSKGAGVGFVSIAREANGDWDFEMVPTEDPKMFFFCFEAYF
ncbi:MAG: hypothetical protein EBT07_05805 [Actinobacteria bacterium]|nr:hypothetical protein [Actinomycetota bacterium]